MSGRRAISLDSLPRFATDEQIGAAMLGPARAKEWCCLALALEKRDPNFPAVDNAHGGRYVPAVQRYYDLRYGLVSSTMPAREDGREHPERWAQQKRRA